MPTLTVAAAVLGLLALGAPAASPESSAQVAVRRVAISFSFSGQEVFLYGQLPAGSDSAFAVMEGPSSAPVRLMKKGRVVLFWMGVRQYTLSHAPSLYLVNLHTAECNGYDPCQAEAQLAPLNASLAEAGHAVGKPAILARAAVEALSGEELPADEAEDVVDGYWRLQERKGLYGVNGNAIRIGPSGMLYHVFRLPTEAPEGKYRITTHFLREGSLVALARNDLFVRQSGLVNWLSRLAERHAMTYGAFTVAIALGAGFLAGTIFKRGGKH
jgi:hypothetical protein